MARPRVWVCTRRMGPRVSLRNPTGTLTNGWIVSTRGECTVRKKRCRMSGRGSKSMDAVGTAAQDEATTMRRNLAQS